MANDVEIFRSQLNVFANGLAPPFFGKYVANIARQARDGLITSGKASPRYQTFVDGTLGKNEEQVNRVIIYDFIYLADAAEFVYQELYRLSPFGPPKRSSASRDGRHYRDSFMIALDKQATNAGSFDFKSITNQHEVTIYNYQPYGRKIDTQRIGKESKPSTFKRLTFSDSIGNQVPLDFFKTVVASANQRFGNTCEIRRVYTQSIPGQYVRKGGVSPGRLTEYPAIIITARS